MAPGPSQLRADQLALLRWTLGGLAGLDSPEVGRFDPLGPAPALPLDRFAAAGLATGLTAALAALAGDRLPSGWAARANEQRAEVAARQRRFAELTPRVLRALHDAGVDAVPVKGAVLAGEVWPAPEARPMADIDVVIPPGQRAAAGAALSAAGLRPAGTNPWEDTFLAWGDGAVGRTDGESADHNGKVELHPGWVERLHNYLVGDRARVIGEAAPGELAGAPCRRLPPGALAAQVVGHLSASVVRAEVRALNVVDAVLALRGLEPAERRRFDALVGGLDARLAGPGLWLVGALAPAAAPGELVDAALDRLPPGAARRLRATPPELVLRDPTGRTSWAWRSSFTVTLEERARAARQLVWPAEAELRGAPGRRLIVSPRPGAPGSASGSGGAWRLHAARVGRAARRRLPR